MASAQVTPQKTADTFVGLSGDNGGNSTDAIMAQLSSDDQAVRNSILAWVVKNLWVLASTADGCRIVQLAMEVGDASCKAAIARQFHGHVLEAASLPHANHVLQKCIYALPAPQLQFVLDELKGNVGAVARHRYGCRVLEKLLENFPRSHVQGLVEEVLEGVERLCRHAFGNFVIQHILEHGTDGQRQRVASVLCNDTMRFAKHRVASHVVKAALLNCNQHDKDMLVRALTMDASELSDLAHHHCGSFVVRELRRTHSLRR
jgi:hypothetical protein